MFWLSLIASVIVGIGSALGESVILGFLKTFPGDTIGYYGSGTGMAGITGAIIFIALKPLGLSDGSIYMIAAPTAIPYFLCFLWLNNQKKKYQYVPTEDEMKGNEEMEEVEEIVKVALEDNSAITSN